MHCVVRTYVQSVCMFEPVWWNRLNLCGGTWNYVMFEPTSTILCSGMYVYDGLAELCMIYEL